MDGLVAKFQLYALCGQQGRILADQRILRLGQDAVEFLLAQGLQIDPEGKAALQLRREVGGLAQMIIFFKVFKYL